MREGLKTHPDERSAVDDERAAAHPVTSEAPVMTGGSPADTLGVPGCARPRIQEASDMRMFTAIRGLASLVLVTAALAGCGTSTAPIVLPPLSAVVLTPTTDTLVVAQQRVFAATALDTTGAAVNGASFDWSSTDTGVFTVNSQGRVTAVGEGSALLIAAAGGKADTATVFVYVQDGWYAQTSGTGSDLNGVAARADGRVALAVGDGGTIVRTADAGASWGSRSSNTAFSLHDVWWASSNIAYAVGNGGTVLRSIDAGLSWSRLTNIPTSQNLFGVWWVGTTHGWAVGSNGVILRTGDGGATWTALNPTASQLNSVSFADTSRGWAVSETGVILGTRDGGRSWYLVQPAVTGQALRGVWRAGDTAAWTVGLNGTVAATSATPDSLQWNLSSLGAANDLDALHVIAPMTAYAVGSNGNGLVMKSTDGGANWSPQVSNSVQALNDVWFVDALRGWAVGASGRIVHTSRGGL